MTWLVDTLVTTGALIALVLVLRRPVSRHFGPGMAYALWALPLLRLFLPPLVLPAAPAALPASRMVVLTDVVAAPAPAAAFAWVEPLLIGLWLAGAIGFLAWRVLGYRALRRAVLDHARPVGIVDGIRLVETPAAPTPLAFGLTDKVIALPPRFMAQPDQTARDLAIAHELEHHRGRDLAVNMAMQPLLALHWFNPLAWLAWRAPRRDQEAACDARVVAGRDHKIRAAYGALIAGYARAPRTALAASIACPVVGPIAEEASVIHRLRSLTMTDPTPVRRSIGRLLLAGAALALPLTASISYAAAQDAVAPPAPPAAPGAPAAPEAPAAPQIHREHRIIIVDKEGGATVDDPALKTRVVTKDGKTIVFKSDKALSEAEIAARVEKALAAMPDLPDMPDLPAGAERRVIVKRVHGEGAPHVMALADADPKIAIACAAGAKTSTIESDSAGADGKQQKIVMRFCSAGATMAKAADGLRSARDRISKDDKLSPAIREDILKQLDAEIERLSKQG